MNQNIRYTIAEIRRVPIVTLGGINTKLKYVKMTLYSM